MTDQILKKACELEELCDETETAIVIGIRDVNGKSPAGFRKYMSVQCDTENASEILAELQSLNEKNAEYWTLQKNKGEPAS